jgi:hypothetical protein
VLLEQNNGSDALLETCGTEILAFPGRRADKPIFSWVEERGEVDGEVARIGGTSERPVSAEFLRLRALDYDWGPDAVTELLRLRHGDEGQPNGGV